MRRMFSNIALICLLWSNPAAAQAAQSSTSVDTIVELFEEFGLQQLAGSARNVDGNYNPIPSSDTTTVHRRTRTLYHGRDEAALSRGPNGSVSVGFRLRYISLRFEGCRGQYCTSLTVVQELNPNNLQRTPTATDIRNWSSLHSGTTISPSAAGWVDFSSRTFRFTGQTVDRASLVRFVEDFIHDNNEFCPIYWQPAVIPGLRVPQGEAASTCDPWVRLGDSARLTAEPAQEVADAGPASDPAQGQARSAFAVRSSLGITAADYPAEARQLGQQGSVGVRVSVSADGRATGCRVVRTSGSPTLDARTCTIAMERGRYNSARNVQGTPIAGEAVVNLLWRLQDL